MLFIEGQDHLLPEAEEITMISIQLAARFLFTTGFHTKKIVRGPASDWYIAFILFTLYLQLVKFMIRLLYFLIRLLYFLLTMGVISNFKYKIKVLVAVL